jgi:hypothetical protein
MSEATPETADLLARIAELEGRLKIATTPIDPATLPRYRLVQPMYLEDDVLHEPPEEITYTGIPNAEAMEPLNESARQALIPIIAAINRKPLDQQIQEATEALHERDRAAAEPVVVYAKADNTVPTTGDDLHLLPGQRKRGRPKKVMDVTMPKDDGRPKPGLMGSLVMPGKDGTYVTGGGLHK